MELEVKNESTDLIDKPQKPAGIGGWLIFPAIGLILSCIISVINFSIYFNLYPGAIRAGYGPYVLMNLFVMVGLFTYLIIAALRFFGKKKSAPATMIRLNAAILGASAFTTMLAFITHAEPFLPEEIKGLIKAAIAASIWIPYFRASMRCKATFTK